MVVAASIVIVTGIEIVVVALALIQLVNKIKIIKLKISNKTNPTSNNNKQTNKKPSTIVTNSTEV